MTHYFCSLSLILRINITSVFTCIYIEMSKRIFVCLLGNDGCGKTTISQLINYRNENKNLIAIERSNNLGNQYGIDPRIVDKLTLEYIFDYENFNQVYLEDRTQDDEEIFWIILDCDIETILKRIETRSKTDIWETRKALHYYQQRFRHLSAHFGIPFLDTTNKTIEQVYQEILDIIYKYSNYYRILRQIGTQTLNYDRIQQFDIENKLYSMIETFDFNQITDLPEYSQQFIERIDKKRLFVRWYVNQHAIEIDRNRNCLIIGQYEIEITETILRLVVEGESKKVYRDISGNPLTTDLAFIILKSTIYSHSMQTTGEIQNLGSIRACGSQLFLEMMWRNDLKHSYRSINEFGIIVSDFVDDISPVEIVVKRFCEGTDKHSFYEILDNENIVLTNSNNEYLIGPYVRFDWRNPNHISPSTKKSLSKNLFYFIYEQSIGKEEFFKEVLSNRQYALPVGDKNITEDLLTNMINIKQTKMSVLKMFMVIQSYFSQLNLQIKDVCFMLDKRGDLFWSEINQDCMRITRTDNSTNKFDKDIWRSGGSTSKEAILEKWNEFNRLFRKYFFENRFHLTELLDFNQYFYQQQIRQLLTNTNLKIPLNLQELWLNIQGKLLRRVLVTLDMFNGEPVLVQSSNVCETHSNHDVQQAIEKIGIFSDILLVDLDGAFGQSPSKNREIIKNLARKYHIFTGGGLRTINDIEDMLKSSVRRCVLASADDTLIEQMPKERLIVELSVNEHNEVLIHGRKTNTRVNIFDKINRLIELGVHAISITFVQSEGHLAGIPRQQIRDLILQIPNQIRKIFIAGGISSIDDLEYLWSFARVIPQLGSAIWKNQISIGSLFNSMTNFGQDGTVSAIIQDLNGPVKGLCYMNRQSIEQTCQERLLYRYSRKYGKVLLKGQTSGDIQHVLKISLDCDSDAMLITVDSAKSFCHRGNHSCFCLQTSIKANIGTIADHIKSKINQDTYSGLMQRHPQLALAKVMEEFWEIMASDNQHQVAECSDMFVHLVMYLNGIGVTMEEIFNELNARRWALKLIPQSISTHMVDCDEIIIGITTGKYTDKTDRFAREHLGFEIIRYPSRNLLVKPKIIDEEKFSKFFGTSRKLSLFASKPKDMAWLLASKRVTHLITFETVVKNYPTVYSVVHQIIDPSISLALISRKGELIQPEQWTSNNRPLIAAEHVVNVTRFFEQMKIDSSTYHLDRVTGSSEGFLINSRKYLLADAIVETGQTLQDNNLEIWHEILPQGQIHIALYARCA